MAWNLVKTWAVGDAGTSTDLNLFVRDNGDYLLGSRTWTAVTFQNNWVDYAGGFQTCAYRRIGDRVVFKGMAKNNSATGVGIGVGTPIFTLPAGWRPAATILFNTLIFLAGTNLYRGGRIDIAATGVVSAACTSGEMPTAVGSFAQLDCIEFELVY